MADAIILRISPHIDQNNQQMNAIFAYLLKSFFLSLQNEDSLANMYLEKARALKPSAKVSDLDIIKKLNTNMNENLANRDVVISSVTHLPDHKHITLKVQTESDIIVIELSKNSPEDYSCPIECIEDFLL